MNSQERIPPDTPKPLSGYLWGALAVLTCPCHLPVLAVVLPGTGGSWLLGKHRVIAAVALTGLFILSLARGIRAFRRSS